MKTLYEAMSVTLGHRKLRTDWIPKMLTKEQQIKQIDFALGFYTHYSDVGYEFLDHIVMSDKTQVNHYTHETKQQSLLRRSSDSLDVSLHLCTHTNFAISSTSNSKCGLPGGVSKLHDITWTHKTVQTKAFIKSFKWEVFDHSSHCPDLAPATST
ncbi:hypothetical protein AVEN_73646-1 [Araneus ventricosus]|uniref:Uncharacterized protein n=1 Tax=Araneus ventricosus TaxID=182803 RepID=A0A4Y2HQH2_ARAVE|nr:hypothetical protein AVEN_73646-1 [Araneus ventricosus]